MKKFIIICGHYGCGKTNLCLNMAMNEVRKGESVIFANLDVTDFYFSSPHVFENYEKFGIQLVGPAFSQTTLDLPVLPQNLYSIFSQKDKTIIVNTGGGDDGVAILHRFNREIIAQNYKMYYVVNYYRSYMKSVDSSVNLAQIIENNSNLKISGVINNSHLRKDTTLQTIIDSVDYAQNVADKLNVPLTMNVVSSEFLSEAIGKVPKLFPVDTNLSIDDNSVVI
ncbi:MAG: hypothetical protein Q4B14_02365 [Clostridia bacterium]|nr:hypothetical protein [Clostridia bacterium]